jgi:hypothetical protein
LEVTIIIQGVVLEVTIIQGVGVERTNIIQGVVLEETIIQRV